MNESNSIVKTKQHFAFAGLWDAWKDAANDTWLQPFSIITTNPNEVTASVHTRMPVIEQDKDYDRWLRSGANELLVDPFRPYEAKASLPPGRPVRQQGITDRAITARPA